ncbi:hypothetical protein Bbelb_410690 [Branchiostoma belcheri]|nr:hypothetical protein Bbelb_410690 [Branchiostoma belcheri]
MSPSRLVSVTLLYTVLCGLTLGNVRRPAVVACRFSRYIRNVLSADSVLQLVIPKSCSAREHFDITQILVKEVRTVTVTVFRLSTDMAGQGSSVKGRGRRMTSRRIRRLCEMADLEQVVKPRCTLYVRGEQTTHCGEQKLSGSFIGNSSILLRKPRGVTPIQRARLLAPVLGRFRDTLLRVANQQSPGELRECLESYQAEQSRLASSLSSFVTKIKESIRAHAPLYLTLGAVEDRVTQALADYAERGISPLETTEVDPAYWRLVLIDMDTAMLELRRIGRLLGSTCED